MFINRKYNNYIAYIIIACVFSACSTEKNTLINRTYHSTTARYNGYFNANELLNGALSGYRNSLVEDYYEILPIEPLPNDEQVVGLYTSIDTAISKCTKVIERHSMPSAEKFYLKKEEHNYWIDENWITIGKSLFYRRDYEGAMRNFEFIRKFFSNDPSIYVADLWMAKTNIAIGKLPEAGFNLSNIEKAIENQEENTAKNGSVSVKSNKKTKGEPVPAMVPKNIRMDFEKTKAILALKKKNTGDAIQSLEKALLFAKKQTDKSRLHFILGQLNEIEGNRIAAKDEFTKTLKYNAPYEMHFNARLKRAFMGGDEKTEKELLKMLRDAKNSKYKDQIYYALADIELQRNNQIKAKEDLTKSAFYSLSNKRQKGMAYEKLGDLAFDSRNYVSAQKYYDSCATAIDDTYPNADAIRNKAAKLADLVRAVETAYFEDSVQRIAQLNERDRIDFIKEVIKQKKATIEAQKKKEAERLRELQENQSAAANASGNGSKWYFNNTKTRSDGFDEFRKLWGSRENEDNWRRSEKMTIFENQTESDKSDSLAQNAPEQSEGQEKDTLTVKALMKNIPLTDSAMAASQKCLIEALYNAGLIYNDLLNEPELAKKQFNKVLSKKTQNDTDLSAAYQLYKINQTSNPKEADYNKTYILATYPNSDYANYLKDPDYFIKRKEKEALAEQEYVTVLERYNKGLFYPVMLKADGVINDEKDNQFRAKYMLLKAMCLGKLNDDKQSLLPVLNQLIKEYPKTEESERATEMIEIIQNGYSANSDTISKQNYIYSFDADKVQWVIVFLEKDENSSVAKTKIADFNREFFGKEKLKVSSKLYTEDQSIILIQEFEDDTKAMKYINTFKKTRKYLLDLQKAKILAISQDNLKLLFETKKIEEYELFHEEYY